MMENGYLILILTQEDDNLLKLLKYLSE